MDAVSLAQLVDSYVVRKRFEAEVLTACLARLMGGGSGSSGSADLDRVPVDKMLELMGVEL